MGGGGGVRARKSAGAENGHIDSLDGRPYGATIRYDDQATQKRPSDPIAQRPIKLSAVLVGESELVCDLGQAVGDVGGTVASARPALALRERAHPVPAHATPMVVERHKRYATWLCMYVFIVGIGCIGCIGCRVSIDRQRERDTQRGVYTQAAATHTHTHTHTQISEHSTCQSLATTQSPAHPSYLWVSTYMPPRSNRCDCRGMPGGDGRSGGGGVSVGVGGGDVAGFGCWVANSWPSARSSCERGATTTASSTSPANSDGCASARRTHSSSPSSGSSPSTTLSEGWSSVGWWSSPVVVLVATVVALPPLPARW